MRRARNLRERHTRWLLPRGEGNPYAPRLYTGALHTIFASTGVLDTIGVTDDKVVGPIER